MKLKIVLFFGILVFFADCRNAHKKDLATIEKQELASGIRNDSLFMGLTFGMERQEFYNFCWAMNKKGVFTEGDNKLVEYQLGKKNFAYPIQMNFFPQFKNEKINVMPVKFTYKGVDLSYPNGQTEKLVKDVKMQLEEWYGGGFFKTSLPDGKECYVQVKGNRRIMIMVEKEYEVMVVFTDLTAVE